MTLCGVSGGPNIITGDSLRFYFCSSSLFYLPTLFFFSSSLPFIFSLSYSPFSFHKDICGTRILEFELTDDAKGGFYCQFWVFHPNVQYKSRWFDITVLNNEQSTTQGKHVVSLRHNTTHTIFFLSELWGKGIVTPQLYPLLIDTMRHNRKLALSKNILFKRRKCPLGKERTDLKRGIKFGRTSQTSFVV